MTSRSEIADEASPVHCGLASLLVALALCVPLVFGCQQHPPQASPTPSATADPRDAVVGENIAKINAWIWRMANGTEFYPADLRGIRQGERESWPANPYTGKPMRSGAGPGDYQYLPVDPEYGDCHDYRLIGYGSEGQRVVTIRGAAAEGLVYRSLQDIASALHAWARDHDDTYPDADFVTAQGLGAKSQYFVDASQQVWPANPLSGQPLHPGKTPGDYDYRVSGDGGRFTLKASVIDWTDPLDGWTVTFH